MKIKLIVTLDVDDPHAIGVENRHQLADHFINRVDWAPYENVDVVFGRTGILSIRDGVQE